MNEQHEALKKFSYQIGYSVKNYKSHGLKATDYNAIVIAGLGGSGIGGQIVKAFFTNEMPVPVTCVADYHLPAFANEKTLVIACSYSGNTEETISVFHEALERKCTILTSTTGGKLAELANANQKYMLQIEPGFQPRMALGFSLTYLVLMMGELLGKDLKEEMTNVCNAFVDFQEYFDEATALFEDIKSKAKSKFVVLADGPCEPLAIRFAQQVQENAKHECFVHVIPEMNHNVIESYYGTLDSVFFLLNANQNDRVTSRFEFMNGLLEVQNHKIVSIDLEAYNWLNIYQLIYRLDWLTLFVADERRVDSLNVPNIKSLKEFLDPA
ncbi:MAG: SIS domain-containing protein [Bacteroidetes bacterium]|nr:MAG: SIS domain-containing protein [Bacteroidota bacterium]